MLLDLETDERMEVTPEYTRTEYREKDRHAILKRCATSRGGAGMDYHLLVTDQPLDGALREYLTIRQGRN